MVPARLRPGRPVIAAAVAVTALIGGGGVALAAVSSSSAAPRTASAARAFAAASAPASSRRCQVKLPLRGFARPGPIFAAPGAAAAFGLGPFGLGPFGLGPFGLGPLGAIHGQFVTPRRGGGYQTIDTQRGTVTAVSASSLTVRSKDGYTKTYRVTGSTRVDAKRADVGSVKVGQTVSVLATVHGSSATATQIADFTALPKMFKIGPKLPRMFNILPKLSKLPKNFTPRHALGIAPCASFSISR
jgi:Domain of unknown function (DUF5666)